MGCCSYGTVSSAVKTVIDHWTTRDIEILGLHLLDLRPSEVPEYADRDWWKQGVIDKVADLVGEQRD